MSVRERFRTVLSNPRPRAVAHPEIVVIDHLEIRGREYQALVEGRRVGLTMREFQVLHALAQRPDQVVVRPDLYAQVWGGRMPYRDRSVDVYVRKVRNKLARVSPGWTYIHTHFGIGYRLSIEPVADADGDARAVTAG